MIQIINLINTNQYNNNQNNTNNCEHKTVYVVIQTIINNQHISQFYNTNLSTTNSISIIGIYDNLEDAESIKNINIELRSVIIGKYYKNKLVTVDDDDKMDVC